MKLINEKYENGWLVKKFKTPDGTTFCTREKCEEEKEYSKPSEKDIEQLRYIKKLRKQQRLDEGIRPPHILSSDLQEIIGKHNKEELIKEIADKFIGLMKNRNQLAISKEDINELVSCIRNHDTKSRIKNLIINYLVKEGKICRREQIKIYKTLQIKPLLTFDKNSWKAIKNRKSVICGSNNSITLNEYVKEIIAYEIL